MIISMPSLNAIIFWTEANVTCFLAMYWKCTRQARYLTVVRCTGFSVFGFLSFDFSNTVYS